MVLVHCPPCYTINVRFHTYSMQCSSLSCLLGIYNVLFADVCKMHKRFVTMCLSRPNILCEPYHGIFSGIVASADLYG